MTENFKIYGLADPDRPEEIRYIGQTRYSLKFRLNGHLTRARKSDGTNYRCCWIRSLLKNNRRPIIILIEEHIPEELINDKEIEIIKNYRNLGYKLTNTDDGGKCCKPKPETIEKIRGKLQKIKLSKEELEELYLVQEKTDIDIGIMFGCCGTTVSNLRKRLNIPTRLGLTEHSREKMSKSHAGVKTSEEHKKHTSEAVRLRYKPMLQKEELEELLKKYKTGYQIGKILNIPRIKIKTMIKHYNITINKNN